LKYIPIKQMNMKSSRRNFLKNAPAGVIGGSMILGGCANSARTTNNPGPLAQDYAELDRILDQPVLKKELFKSPVIIDRLELLRRGNNFLCRVTSKDGAEGVSVGNNMQMVSLYPIFQLRLRPFFIGKDARDWENLLEEVYVHQSNYKLQGLALWIPLATIEFAVLDMLGKMVGKPMGELIGDIHNTRIAVYQANGSRGRPAEETIALIEKDVSEYNAKALKFKVGGRMSKNAETPAGRTEKLIPLVRKTFGDDMVIYADSNGSYTVDEGIRIGKIMEEYKYDFYEEPVPFDWYEETKMVADALKVPIAGGEQEPSMHNFRWLIQNNGLQIVQPDIFYFGGMIRSMKVARMADSKGMTCVPHISGSGLGYLYMMHFVSAVPNAGPYHEFKGFNYELPLECPTSSLESEDGVIQVPTGPGAGVEIDPDFIGQHKVVS
jgi:L-alanine-DL-glutamate epimerase-like enolase superfamily enzyme